MGNRWSIEHEDSQDETHNQRTVKIIDRINSLLGIAIQTQNYKITEYLNKLSILVQEGLNTRHISLAEDRVNDIEVYLERILDIQKHIFLDINDVSSIEPIDLTANTITCMNSINDSP